MHLLFVCTGNTCRSPMAEFIAKANIQARGGAPVTASSAGVAAFDGAPMSELSERALAAQHIPYGEHRARRLTEAIVRGADFIFCMEPQHLTQILLQYPHAAKKAYTLKGYAFEKEANGLALAIQDPYGQPYAAYMRAAEEIAAAVSAMLRRLLEA